MNIPIPNDALTPIKEAIFHGQKILAIKLHRDATGASLVDAKNEVERLETELRASSPEKFTKAQSGKGCLSVAVVLCVIVCAVIVWAFN